MIKNVIFDFDDTLFDHRHSSREGLRAVWKRYTCFHEMTLEALETEHGEILEQIHFSHVLFGKMTIDEARAERFKFLFLNRGIEVDFNTAENAAQIYRMAYQKNRRRSEGAAEILKHFKKEFKIGIITNNLISEQKEKLDFLELTDYIDLMVTSEEARVPKPDPQIFNLTLKKLQAKPEETVMIGDSWEHDIKGAFNAGLKCIWLNHHKLPCPDPAVALEIRTLNNPEYIKSLFSSTGTGK
ncbi:MAG TPA: HAD family hydrolase [Ignavibacteria bacterium]|nr:HAD family hydrolase [Ignavibacteria bacterium]HMQ99961.1 HAD family hydrolase [Ignavibacteria bacterium]